MIPEHDEDDWLHTAFVRSRDLHTPSPAPVDRILRAGRARRRRRRVTLAGGAAASVLAAALALPLAMPGLPPGPPSGTPTGVTARPSPTASRSPEAKVTTATVARGVVDGHEWSVTLEFHHGLPDGYGEPAAGDDERSSGAGTVAPGRSSLLCQRMVIGGVRIDHQGGPWADCQAVDGTHDPGPSGSAGLWGLHDKGLSGIRLFVALPQADVAHGVVALSDGSELKGTTVTVPGTSYRAWAVAIPDGRTITAVDSYDAHHHLLDHDTNWR